MSKKFGKILSFVLALVMVCSLLPMSVMAAENVDYTVTFAPGDFCNYKGEGTYPTETFDGTGEFLLPEPAPLNLVGSIDNLTFRGWTLKGGDGTYYSAGDNVADMITGDVTFLANYVKEVTFAPGNLCLYTGEGKYPSEFYDESGTFELPDPEAIGLVGRQDNFVFQGWTLEGGDSDIYFNIGANVADMITSNVTFLANFREDAGSDTVTYIIKPGTIANDTTNLPRSNGPIPQQYVTEISLPVTNAGITSEFGWIIPNETTFVRWEKNDGSVIAEDPGTDRTISFLPANGDEYTAIWQSATVTTYAVALHPGKANGQAVPGPAISDGSFIAGSEYYGPATVPYTHVGYRSTGWSYTEDGDAIKFPITVNDNIDLYALWEENETADYVFVTLYPGEGATFQAFVAGYEKENDYLLGQAEKNRSYNLALPGAFDTAIIKRDGKPVEVNATFATEPEGMEFEGWKSEKTGTVYYSGELITVDEDDTFTAQWRTAGSGPYNLIFNAGLMANYDFDNKEYRNYPSSIKVNPGEAYELPTTKAEVLDKFGWNVPPEVSFEGWVLANVADEPITVVQNIRQDVVVVALWKTPTLNEFTVTFDANDGSGYMEPLVFTTYNTSYSFTVPACTFTPPEGMRFARWVDANGRAYAVGRRVTITNDVTLIAQWTEVTTSNFTKG